MGVHDSAKPLDGFAQILLVDYEYIPDGFDPDEIASGFRGRHWFGDHLAVGATWIDENRAGDNYSLKGADVVVRGSVGHMAAFMAQTGCLVVCGDAGEALGDSIYEARLYVRGDVAGLGADCVEKEVRPEHVAQVRDLLARAGIDDVDPAAFRRYGSARQLYTFKVDNAGAY